MSQPPLIPEHIWRRLLEFLQGGKTGQISLNVSEGRVLSCDIREHLKLSN